MGRRTASSQTHLGIGGQIRLHRRRAGLTQLELARKMGTSQAVIARMENEGNVNLATVGRALAALGLHGSTHLYHEHADDRGVETDWLVVRVDLVSGRGEDLDPPPGRAFVVSPRHTLAEFGHAIDVAFGRWDHAHMHSFRFRWQGEYVPAEGGWDAATDSLTTRIGDLKLRQGDPFVYVFDLGDKHTHLGVVEHTRVDPVERVGILPDRPVPVWGWGSIPDQYGRRWSDDTSDDEPVPDRERLLRPYFRRSQPPSFERLPRLPRLDPDAREALHWPAEEACGGRELASWEKINGLHERLARALPLLSADGGWRVTHLWEPTGFPARSWACVACGAAAQRLGASSAAWQGGRDVAWLKDGIVCEGCLGREEPEMLAFLQELEAPAGANELADAFTIFIEVRGGARVVAGESSVPPDLVGRAEHLHAINEALGEGLEAAADGKPGRLREAVEEIRSAAVRLPTSDNDMIAGWLNLADVGLHARERSELNLARSLANRRREATARYEVVLRKLRGAT